MLTDADYDRLAGIKTPAARPSYELSTFDRLVDLVCSYLEEFTECRHGMKPSVCAHCRFAPRNNPARWGYDPHLSDEENQLIYEEYLAGLAKFFARKGAQEREERVSVSLRSRKEIVIPRDQRPAMLVNKRPINARVRAVHVSKQGAVNVKQLGISRYSEVLNWGRKYCGWHGMYEKRLK